ncbi:hypothetical protein Goklo_025947, partial [Gossypium klotzschianum]|nr:hypothetical protein [Gossypium klotzschianum]MBA0733635.1 hypothetical protein [Gossypium gossypioides]
MIHSRRTLLSTGKQMRLKPWRQVKSHGCNL